MATTPLTEIIEVRRRRLSRRALARAVWLAVDLGAVTACVVLAVHG